MRIVTAHIQDYKRVRSVTITPDADSALVLIGGKNRAGKSSIIDALSAAIGGAKSIAGDPVRHGADAAEIRIELDGVDGKLTVRRVINPDKSTSLEIRDADDTVVAARVDPRQAFGRRTLLRWDALDFAYFSSYAMWNYLCLPFLLTYPGVSVRQMPGNQTVLSADFPADVPTHSPTQQFHFDASGLLIRHDYTAEVVGSRARAAHLCTEYRRFGGLRVSTVRRVYPRGPLGRPLPFPTLVAIDIHDVHPRTTRRS